LAFYDGPYVFPGKCSIAAPITPQGLREAIKGTVQTFTGVPLTPHQFRHLAASLFLRENKGHYEEVRQLLGHADIKTTIRSYCGIETETSVRRYHEILEGLHERPKGVAKRDTRNPPTPSKQKRRA
jgi:integrase